MPVADAVTFTDFSCRLLFEPQIPTAQQFCDAEVVFGQEFLTSSPNRRLAATWGEHSNHVQQSEQQSLDLFSYSSRANPGIHPSNNSLKQGSSSDGVALLYLIQTSRWSINQQIACLPRGRASLTSDSDMQVVGRQAGRQSAQGTFVGFLTSFRYIPLRQAQ
ncbi:hypothetical protein GE21DRAFT_1307875 [Neurospora crassa]|uniref:Uncharacterized protein B8B20.170 n=1 Tax=Neurospora crassa TaxID=5141 RepID=Q9P5Q8_NEUCS|nr:hypothetical protein GE21DRAFT_1307875 [Neurospora crassa]CAB91464.2 hypothetical protein [Neurospora crassa]